MPLVNVALKKSTIHCKGLESVIACKSERRKTIDFRKRDQQGKSMKGARSTPVFTTYTTFKKARSRKKWTLHMSAAASSGRWRNNNENPPTLSSPGRAATGGYA